MYLVELWENGHWRAVEHAGWHRCYLVYGQLAAAHGEDRVLMIRTMEVHRT